MRFALSCTECTVIRLRLRETSHGAPPEVLLDALHPEAPCDPKQSCIIVRQRIEARELAHRFEEEKNTESFLVEELLDAVLMCDSDLSSVFIIQFMIKPATNHL